MPRTALATLTAALSLAPLACDAEDDLAFRQAPETVLYLSQFEADITPEGFADIVNACPSKRKLALTFTRYPITVGGADDFVIGLGFSAMGNTEWADCYEDLMLALGAKP
jgi:hypothetical protein